MKNSEKNQEVREVKSKINLETVKINFQNAKTNLQDVEVSIPIGNRSIYKDFVQSLPDKEQRSLRRKIRDKVELFDILIRGNENVQKSRGRNSKDVEKSIIDFLEFYKKYWRIQDFKIDSFTDVRNPEKREKIRKLLEFVQSALEN